MVALAGSFLSGLERDEMRAELAAAVVVRQQYRDRLAELDSDGVLSAAWRWKLERQVEALTAHIERFTGELAT